MRIAMFADNNYPELSGITDTMLITGAELMRRGHEVILIGPRYSPADYARSNAPYPQTPEEDAVHGIPFIRLPSLPLPFSPTGQSRLALPIGASYSALDQFKPDVVHTHSPYGLGREALGAARRYQVPLIGTNHTAIEDFFPLGSLMRRFDAHYYNHCNTISTPYAALLSRMREAGFKKQGQVISNPVELGLFTPAVAGEQIAQKRALGSTGPVVLYAGRLAPEKKVDDILRAMPSVLRTYPTATLVLTGRGSAEQNLRDLAKELKIESQIRFTGFLTKEKLAEVYRAADAFAFMSTSDSQSIALMQAYATGVPAVCARARGLPDYTPEDVGFLVEPGDSRALAEKLITVLDDTGLRTRMGAAALEFVKKLSPESVAAQWEEVYSQQTALR